MVKSNDLRVYILNVGQADTSVLVGPHGQIVIIDAFSPKKLLRLLDALGAKKGSCIDTLIITHPHQDHYAGAGKLLSTFSIKRIILPLYKTYIGTAGYRALINLLDIQGRSPIFCDGHTSFCLGSPVSGEDGVVEFDVAGPSMAVIHELQESGDFTPNHLSLITRVKYGKFCAILAGDAQMENWQHFDQEGLCRERAQLVKAAHHGSRHGTQAERLERLDPKLIVVSSNPTARHRLPDLVGAAILHELGLQGHLAFLTADTGTVEVVASHQGIKSASCFGECRNDDVPLTTSTLLSKLGSKWAELVKTRLSESP